MLAVYCVREGGSTQTFSAGIITTWQNTEKRNPVEDPGWCGGDGKEAAGYPVKKLMGGCMHHPGRVLSNGMRK